MSIETMPTTATIPTPLDLVEETRRAVATYAAARAKADAASDAFRAAVHPKVWELHTEIEELEGEARFEHMMILVSEFCRHLPGLAPAIRILWMHVLDTRTDRLGVCCTDGGPIEP